MQLKRNATAPGGTPGMGASLAAATCALLGTSVAPPLAAQEAKNWDVESSLLYYGEAGGRVQDLSANALLRKAVTEDQSLALRLTVDALTGASPSGAIPSTTPQTFTRPSGGGTYTAPAGTLPLDGTFVDTRIAADASWEKPLSRLTLVDLGVGLSHEHDYQHLGLNGSFAREFNRRNTRLSLGFAFADDSVNPVGGVRTPFTAVPPPTGGGSGGDDGGEEADRAFALAFPAAFDAGGSSTTKRSKQVTDLMFGITQVLGERTIAQLNFGYSAFSGYLNDPYKVLSVVDPVTGEPIPDAANPGANLNLYENRPDTRTKESVYALVKHDLNGDVLSASYRYMVDDWGISSHTIDLHYRRDIDTGSYLEPHLRLYTQTAADFYHTLLFDGAALPQYASADYRLGRFDAVTLGVKYAWPSDYGQWSARVEYYEQIGKAEPGASIGILQQLDLFPKLQAVIAQFSFNFGR
jgi:Protein of unknown function (DUF3570)